jgi:hypothetical protein
MKKLSICAFAILATASLACSSSPGKSDGGTTNGYKLTPDMNGFMDGTVASVLGAWYSYGDSYNNGGPGDCQNGGFTADQCSMATSPAFGAPFANTGGVMCLTGTAAVVMNMAYGAIWGVGIGFDFSNAGTGDAGSSATPVKNPWDAATAAAKPITGFSFHITGVPVGGHLRVEFPFQGEYMSDAPYWSGAANDLSPIMMDGDYSFKWTDVGGPSYLTSPTPPAFDSTKIISAQFHVVTNTNGPIAVNNLCVSNVTLTTD